uniref:Very long-chain specific acyl-CoA dehydrogenase, mitochondrial n=1 Tax=Plectus sambesii TaxID=2011161 RepID=A0A914X7Y4_9BILA
MSSTRIIRLSSRLTNKASNRSYAAAAINKDKPKDAPKKRAESTKAIYDSPSFGMNMFRGLFQSSQVFPYPVSLDDERRETLSMIIGPAEKFFEEVNNATKNDEEAKIPKEVLRQFGELGALGAVVPVEYEGAGLNNTQMARLAEIVGANDLAMGVVMGAHQSIGYKGILLYGNEEQKKKYLPDLATGRKFAAFCLTEPSSGSDANSIRTRAVKSSDGKHYVINGGKIWISNGGFADVFTVFAQTQVVGKDGVTKDKVSAFIVERAYGGVTNGPPEKKMGIKGSNTAEVHFEDVKVPIENMLGEEGEGFKVAMNILNNGRFGIPAACTGSMKHCIQKTIEHVTTRTQFGAKLETYGMVKEKIAEMLLRHYVTESIVYMLAANMDKGATEYQIEAAIGKIVGSENAWWVCDEAIQLHGGMGFMKECGLERVLRDLRIFRIFEGANDVMRLFVALTGCQYAGMHLKELAKKVQSGNLKLIFSEAQKRASRSFGMSSGPSMSGVVHSALTDSAKLASISIDQFGAAVESLLREHGKNVIDQQFLLRRIADAAIDIYSMVAVLSRCSHALEQNAPSMKHEQEIVDVFCKQASKRVMVNLQALKSDDSKKEFKQLAAMAEAVCKNGSLVQQHPLGV